MDVRKQIEELKDSISSSIAIIEGKPLPTKKVVHKPRGTITLSDLSFNPRKNVGSLPIRISKIEEEYKDKKNMNFISSEEIDEEDEDEEEF